MSTEAERERGRAYKKKADQVRKERMAADPVYAAERKAAKYAQTRAWEAKDPDFRRKYNAAAQARWRTRNPDKVKEQREKHPQHIKRKALRERRETSGCVRCGEGDGRCLAFHHRDPATKSFSIGTNVNRHSLEALLLEADKCDVLCHNCHAKEHIPE